MRKLIKGFIALFILVLGIFAMPITAYAATNIPAATSGFYVNDFADVFSDDEETRLMDNAVKLSDEHDGIQVVVTTVTSLEGNAIEDYALEMYNQYGIGKDDMGLLILLSTGDRDIRVEVGKAMEAYITDSKAGRFIDRYAIPSLRDNKFNEGLINLQEAFISEIVSKVDAESSQTTESESNFNILNFVGAVLIISVAIIVMILIVVSIRKTIYKIRARKQELARLNKQVATLKKENEVLTGKCTYSEFEARQSNESVQRLKLQNQDLANGKLVAQRNNEELQKQLQSLSSRFQTLEAEHNTLKDRYARVQILYPTADQDVASMIEEEIRQKDMAIAAEVDSLIEKAITLPASKDNLPQLSEARHCYLDLSEAQLLFIKSDFNKLNDLYNKSVELKKEYDREQEVKQRKNNAATAASTILAIISFMSIGRAKDFSKLKKAKSIYDSLDSSSRMYFDKSVADKLNTLYAQAKRDKEAEEAAERRRQQEEAERKRRQEEAERQRRREEEEARRRRMQSSSSSSFSHSSHSSYGSHSHHSGFGGRSGGGGASRKF